MDRVQCRGCGRRAPTKVQDRGGGERRGADAQHPTEREKVLRRELDKARKVIKDMQGVAKGQDASGAIDAGVRGEKEEACDFKKVDDQIERIRVEIKNLEGLQDCAEQVASRKARIEQLQKEKAAARPVHQQLRDAQGRCERRQKMLKKKLEEDIPRLEEAARKAQEALGEAREEAAGMAVEVKDLQEEVRRIAEVPKAGSAKETSEQRATAWAQMVPMFPVLLKKAVDPEQSEVLGRMQGLRNGLSADAGQGRGGRRGSEGRE